LLLEFQSTSEHFMALRVLAYAALLWQHLVREKPMIAGGKLPPLLPVVLYNGERRWRAPEAVHALVGLPEASLLWQWQPQLRYHLIDIRRFSAAALATREGLPALWFRLENAAGQDDVKVVVRELRAWLGAHPAFSSVEAVFVALLRAMIAPVDPAARLPADLLEVENMLASERWVERWQREGEEKGRQVGRQEGKAEMLLRLLQRRFGTLPAWATERVTSADTAALEDWSLRILDASNLEDVVGEQRR